MASPHFSASEVKRGSGHSSVASAAYNARADLTDLRTGETHDYTRHRTKCLFEGIYAPKDAPEWARDRAQLWNHVEAFEKHRRAILAQDITIALPHELTLEQNRRLLQDWVRENVTRKGLIADVAIHAPDARGDARNIHAHVMIVTRKLDGSEFVRAKDRFDTYTEKDAARKADLLAMRGSWEKLANRHLERYGHEARIDMGRKPDGEATLHMGKHATAQERRGEATERGDQNREIEAENKRRRDTANKNAQAAANENEPDAAELRQRQRAGFQQQDQDRANATWDAADGSTLSNMRRRDREAGASRSTENEARRALDDLARVDPHGTARNFGHHAGDHLKSPEDMRREHAERLRGFAAEDPRPEPVQDRARPDPTRERDPSQSWTKQAGGWDAMSREHRIAAMDAHEAWTRRRDPADQRPAFTLREYVDYVQEREAKKAERSQTTEHQVKQREPVKAAEPVNARRAWASHLRSMADPQPIQERPQEATRKARERPGLSTLRAALATAQSRLATVSGRLEQARAAFVGFGRTRTAEAGGSSKAQQHRDENSSREANRRIAEGARQEEHDRQARQRETDRAAAADYHSKPARGTGQPKPRRSVFADELAKAEAEAAVQRLREILERPGEHDHHERGREP